MAINPNAPIPRDDSRPGMTTNQLAPQMQELLNSIFDALNGADGNVNDNTIHEADAIRYLQQVYGMDESNPVIQAIHAKGDFFIDRETVRTAGYVLADRIARGNGVIDPGESLTQPMLDQFLAQMINAAPIVRR